MTNAPALVPVILAGGSGTRLWPLSRSGHPKQFLPLAGSQDSLFQQTLRRLQALAAPGLEPGQPLVVAHESHRFLALAQLAQMACSFQALLLEPQGRNTAPALTLAALAAREGGQDPVLVVSPSDHHIADEAACGAALRQAVQAAAGGAIVVLGVAPTRPETGYGYIEADTGGPAPWPVRRFVEKPDAATAQALLDGGRHRWNSGMLVLRASAWLSALERLAPDILQATQAAWQARSVDQAFTRPGAAQFEAVRAESADYAVLERCPGQGIDLRMVPLDAPWSDLGAWDAVWQASARDAQGNAASGDVLLHRTRESLVMADGRLVAVVGLDHVVVVDTPDALLVMDRGSSQDVKAVAASLARRGRDEAHSPRKVHRPWGWYDSVDRGPRFQVKRLHILPGASLSLQMHHHRAEHWTVVCGVAEVTCGERRFLLSENESTFIPRGMRHRLANPGKVPLEIIEVQSGEYLGEDDIVRYEDDYGRGPAAP